MRIWGVAVGVTAAVALGFSLGRVAWPVNAARVAVELSDPLGGAEHTVALAPAAVRLTLLPRPTLHFEGIAARAGNDEFRLRAARGEATLRLDYLLAGRYVASGLKLNDANVEIDLDRAALAVRGLKQPPFPSLSLIGGAVTLTSARAGGWRSRFDIREARFDWPAADRALRLAATGAWHEQPVQANVELTQPVPAAKGEASALRLSVVSPLARLDFSGDISATASLEGERAYRGTLSAHAPSLEDFAHWLRLTPGALPPSLDLEATASGVAGDLRLADARITLAEQSFEGVLDFARTAEGVSVSGTLAADKLDLSPLLGPPPKIFEASSEWSKASALPVARPDLELDLRVSAAHADWGQFALDNAAASLSERANELTIKLLEAGFAHGAVSGEMSVADKPDGCRSRLSLDLENVDFGGWLADLGAPMFSGHGALRASARARGRSPAEIVASAEGEGSVEVADGALLNLNFEEALRRAQRRPVDPARDMNAGATRFAAAKGRFEIKGGEARFVDASTQSPGVALLLSGALDLNGRLWRAGVQAWQGGADGAPVPDGAHVDFTLGGPWSAPTLTPVLPPAD